MVDNSLPNTTGSAENCALEKYCEIEYQIKFYDEYKVLYMRAWSRACHNQSTIFSLQMMCTDGATEPLSESMLFSDIVRFCGNFPRANLQRVPS